MAETKRKRPASSVEEREDQLIVLAYDYAEDQIRNGTVSNQVLLHFLRMGSSKEKLEQRLDERELELKEAKTAMIKSAETQTQMYNEALKAFTSYQSSATSPDD